MTMALIAQAVLHQLRQRLGEPTIQWDAKHLANDLLRGLEGDVRVTNDTIIVTYYNAPQAEQLRGHYQNLPDKLHKTTSILAFLGCSATNSISAFAEYRKTVAKIYQNP